MLRAFAAATLMLALPATVVAAEPAGRFLERSARSGDLERTYKVYLPPGHDAKRRWPVILFLHGAGERGTDGLQHTEVGLGRVLREHADRFPAVIVFPQAPAGGVWMGDLARFATSALEQSMAEFGGDPDRVYLAGLSMGAYGAWLLAFEEPQRYAAIISVAGGVVPPAGRRARLAQLPPTLQADDPYAATAGKLKHVPAWLFHGADDPTVPASESRQLAAALKQAGAPVRHTEYAGVPHNAWDRAFAEEELPRWLFAQKRSAKGR